MGMARAIRGRAIIGASVILLGLPSVAGAKVLKVWLAGYSGEATKWLQQNLVKDFEKANPGTQVQFTTVGWDVRKERLAVAMSAGAAPDVITAGNGTSMIDGLEGLLMPLDPYLAHWKEKDKIYDKLWDGMRSQGKTYGVPMFCDTRGVLYNKTILFKAGIDADVMPQTFEAMSQIAKKTMILDSTSMKVVQAGYTSIWGTYLHQDLNLYLTAAGAALTDKNMIKPTFNTPLGLSVVSFMEDLYDTSFPTGYKPLSNSDGGLFVDGKAAMVRGLTVWMPMARAKSKAFASQLVFHPVRAAEGLSPVMLAYVNGFSMPKGSKNPELAFSFIKAMSGAKSIFKVSEMSGACAANRDALPMAKEADSYMLPWYNNFTNVVTAPVFPENQDTSTPMDAALLKVFSHKADLKQSFGQLSATWEKGLDRWWSAGLRKSVRATLGK